MIGATIAVPKRMYEYPYFMAMTFAGFVLPQAYGIAASQSAPEEWLTYLFLMSFLCLACCWAGYRLKPKAALLTRLSISVDPTRFATAGVFLMAIGNFFQLLIDRLPEESKGTQWTGVVTIYLFIASQAFTGFAICLYCALVYKKRIYWALAGFGATTPLAAVLFYGRRESAVLLVLTMALTVFFAKQIPPPRLVIVLSLTLAAVLIPATMQFRQAAARGEQFKELFKIDYLDNLRAYSDPTTISEVRNAMYAIAAARTTGIYGYGANYWNRIVFAFVPAQILGKRFKDSLMIGDPENSLSSLTASVDGYQFSTGSTVTCIADTFQQFWFFGALFYAAVGYFFRHLWISATVADSPIIRLFYIQAMVGTMRSVSHGSGEVLPAMIYSAIFLFLVTIYARERPRPA